jgi:hypothetical protein
MFLQAGKMPQVRPTVPTLLSVDFLHIECIQLAAYLNI